MSDPISRKWDIKTNPCSQDAEANEGENQANKS